jgi:putative flippase GtrA
VIALGASAAANLTANRRITFARRGRPGRLRHFRTGVVVAAVPLAVTVATLVGLGMAGVASRSVELAALTIVNATASCAKFVLLRGWVFGSKTGGRT